MSPSITLIFALHPISYQLHVQSYRSTHRSQTCRASSSFQTNKNLTNFFSQGESFYEWYEKCFCFLKAGFVYPIDTWHSVWCLIIVILRVFYLLSFSWLRIAHRLKNMDELSAKTLFFILSICVSVFLPLFVVKL